MTDKHPFVLLEHSGREIEVDEQIAPLIQHLWDNDIETSFCCQGTPNQMPADSAYIAFPDGQKLIKFLEMIDGFLDPDHNKVDGEETPMVIPAFGIAIICGSFPPGMEYHPPRYTISCSAAKNENWSLMPSFYFPPEELPALLEHLGLEYLP